MFIILITIIIINNNVNQSEFFSLHILQIIASTVKNFLLLDLGLSIAFPSIVIPALTGFPNAFNKDEQLTMTPVQVSWFGESNIQ